MTDKLPVSTARWQIAILIISAVLLIACASRRVREAETVVIPADRQVRALENGNYEVTPAWLQDRYQYEAWITEQLKACRDRQ